MLSNNSVCNTNNSTNISVLIIIVYIHLLLLKDMKLGVSIHRHL